MQLIAMKFSIDLHGLQRMTLHHHFASSATIRMSFLVSIESSIGWTLVSVISGASRQTSVAAFLLNN